MIDCSRTHTITQSGKSKIQINSPVHTAYTIGVCAYMILTICWRGQPQLRVWELCLVRYSARSVSANERSRVHISSCELQCTSAPCLPILQDTHEFLSLRYILQNASVLTSSARTHVRTISQPMDVEVSPILNLCPQTRSLAEA